MRKVEFSDGVMTVTETKRSKILTVSKPLKISQEVIDMKIITSCYCCNRKFKDGETAYTIITKGHAIRACKHCASPLLGE